MSLKVLAVHGSPRTGGSSDTLLDEAVRGIKNIERDIVITHARPSSMKMRSCKACFDCFKSGICSTKDEFTKVFKTMMNADIVLVASPIYFMGPPSALKAFVDRCLVGYARKVELGKTVKRRCVGGIILTAGQPEDKMFKGTRSILKSMMWSVDIKYLGQVLSGDMDKHGSVKKCPKVLARARRLGRSLAQAASSGRRR